MTDRILIGRDQPSAANYSKPLYFDTNVWLLINGPYINSSDHRTKKYSWFYGAALKAGAEIRLPQLVVSEFVNRCIRWQADAADWNGIGKIHEQPKYPIWIASVADDLFHIIESCHRCDDNFSSADMDLCLKEAAGYNVDFNDVLLARMCRLGAGTLVTDDVDFRYQDIPIITANPALARLT